MKPTPSAVRDLAGRVALVTGVGRREGIGFAVASELAARGAAVFVQAFPDYDAAQPHGADPGGTRALAAELEVHGSRVAHCEADFFDAGAPRRVMGAAREAFGHVDVLVVNHTYWSGESLTELSAEEIDRHLAVNVRASLLLVSAFAKQHAGRPGGRVVLLTSGQQRGPMPGELAYVASKGALAALTASLSDALIERGITVNAVNPGPTDTGWISDELRQKLLPSLPLGRPGRPEDAARLIGWLVSDTGQWVTGQVIDSEGGFRRR